MTYDLSFETIIKQTFTNNMFMIMRKNLSNCGKKQVIVSFIFNFRRRFTKKFFKQRITALIFSVNIFNEGRIGDQL